MEVETCEVEEVTSDMTGEEDGAYLAAIDRLELEGQKNLCCGEKEKTVCPYRKMTAEEDRVFKALFPRDVEAKRYSDGKIPIRVLQVIEHAKSLNMFKYIRVWCPENADDPDPVLVGYVGDYDWSPREKYILARWGDCLMSFDELKKKAAQKLRIKYMAICKKLRKELDTAISSANELTDMEFFETNSKEEPKLEL